MKRKYVLCMLFCLLFSLENLQNSLAQTLAFPGAEGFGRYATGARGYSSRSVYFVTNLNDSGPGSFRDAVSQPGRFIIFKVSGIITLSSKIQVAANTTIAGQTAPGDGVVLYGRGVSFSGASNTISRHLRIRLGVNGGAGKNDDASGIANGTNIILDHMSFSWGLDEVFSINWDNKGSEPDNITIQNSIIGQGLHRHNHSAGGLIQTGGKISILKSLYMSNKTRNPKVKGINEFVNNVVYNFGNANTTYADHSISADAYILGGESSGESNVTLLNNYFIAGPATPQSKSTPFSRGNGNFNLYQRGNYYDRNYDGVLNGTEMQANSTWYPGIEPENFKNAEDYSSYPTIAPGMSASEAYQWIVSNVGATFPNRDQVDAGMIADLMSIGKSAQYMYRETDNGLSNGGLGDFYPAQLPADTDNDGIPDEWEERLGLNKNDPSDALKESSAHAPYLNIEVYINMLTDEQPTDFVRPPKNIKATSLSYDETPARSVVTLSWENNSPDVKTHIERSVDAIQWTPVTTTDINKNTFNDDNLKPNTLYYYRLKSIHNQEESVFSTALSHRTTAIPTAPVPAAQPSPVHLYNHVILNEGAIDLSWTGSSNTKTYAVYFGKDAGNLILKQEVAYSARPGIVISDLENNTSYYWRVDASNDKGITTGEVWTFRTEQLFPKMLVGHWNFDETTEELETTLLDQSAFANHGELSRTSDLGISLRTEGVHNGALDLKKADPSTYSASIPHKDHLYLNNSSFTITFWMKAAQEDRPTSTNSSYILCKGSITKNTTTGATGNRFNIEVKEENFRFAIDNDNLGKDEITAKTSDFYTGQWTHVTVIRDTENKKIRLYRNGKLNVEATISKATSGIGELSDLIIGNIGELEFLKQNNLNSAPYFGKLDELKIYNYALADSAIQRDYLEHVGLLAAHTPFPTDKGISSRGDQTTVSWSGGENTTSFDIYFGTSADQLHKAASLPATEKNFTFRLLDPGSIYYWKVIVQNNGVSKESPVWSFTANPNKRELVGYYSFDDQQAVGYDYSKYANHGKTRSFSASPFVASGKSNGAVEFKTANGTTSTKAIVIPAREQNKFDYNSFSISLWMKGSSNTYTTSATNAYLIQKGTFSGVGRWYGIQLNNNGNLVFAIDDDSSVSGRGKNEVTTGIAANNLFNNQWHHIVAVRDVENAKISLYIDGKFIKTASALAQNIGQDNVDLLIGNSAENKIYRDQLDEVKLYNYALSDEDISQLYATGIPVAPPVLITPAQDAVLQNALNPVFKWRSDEETYSVFLGKSTDDWIKIADHIRPATFTVPEELEYIQSYYWKVEAFRDTEKASSNIGKFTTEELPRPVVQVVPITVNEGSPKGNILTRLQATNPLNGPLKNWKLLKTDDPNQNGIPAIEMDTSSGEVRILDPADFSYGLTQSIKFTTTVDNDRKTSEETELTININFVNQAPTFQNIADLTYCNSGQEYEVLINGISPGKESSQQTTLSIQADQADLFDELQILQTTSSTGAIRIILKETYAGTTRINVTVKDNGGTNNGGIDSYTQSFNITATSPPELKIAYDNSRPLLENKPVTLNVVNPSADYSYEWFANESSIGSGNSITLNAGRGINYKVTGKSSDGCIATASLQLDLIESTYQLKINNIITPNNDGINDYWLIKNIEADPENEVYVYSQNGRLVFSARDYQNDWTGISNSSPLPNGTYMYKVIFNKKEYAGYLDIVNPQ
ncbi:LamG-like jellyroll fold domain-containing protein [Sphingobacterium spiritivorum]|uniref:Fibronectin type III domain protein n=1 Tax=Sphingobacterium spiritivorum ATCC 33861 TaxID=525373 RepID=D7VL28_SPHSI|nr:LamG-like jellyroll fold domain-containing protein [Sphingobacterium spiritivorum]EFK58301.1 fibronectin type III domain protein [Sphingobacterium spiritivorum ATCC 33861]QQT37055.1 gliding motility-associated C-terminal domain-containing protein [Sphingobacterium spiritivorum]WQD33826.1 LamG-like jellyroll fold domain-containing protein [Sphingobacterium spiritivorum]SUJ27404.1 gliding motility-associated C-terminal domain [Sphingobacterium spiritivorum]